MRRNSWKKPVFFVSLLVGSQAYSRSATPGFGITVEPIVGFERVEKIIPAPAKFVTRITYGARVTAGLPLIAAEAEYTRGSDTETNAGTGLSEQDIDDKLKVGVRSKLKLGGLLAITGRGGVQGKQNQHIQSNGSTQISKTTSPVTWKPYAGAALNASLANNVEVEGGVTVVFNEWPNMKKNEYQTTLGLTIKYP